MDRAASRGAAPSSGRATPPPSAGGPAAAASRARWIVNTVVRVADVCRAQARLLRSGAGGAIPIATTAVAARSGGRAVARADAVPSVRRRPAGPDAPAPAVPSTSPLLAQWFDWAGGLDSPETAAAGGGGLGEGTIWLAVIAGLGALALAGLATRGHGRGRGWRSILDGPSALRGEQGQALPLVLVLVLLLFLLAELVLAILML
jgi:hypothetical protein